MICLFWGLVVIWGFLRYAVFCWKRGYNVKTRRLISTISYNTDLFLASRLQELCHLNVIEWAHWIRHLPESDETKVHWHLICQPARAIDTLALCRQFIEPDVQHTDMSLVCMPWRPSKFADWVLYSLHDPAYLGTKGLKREKRYTIHEVFSTHPDMLLEDYKQIDLTTYGIGAILQDAVSHGRTWESVISSGVVPRSHWRYWKEVFGAMGGTFRFSPDVVSVR